MGNPHVQSLESETMSMVARRLLPFLFVLYIFAFLDRTNVSIAALQMNDDLHFSASAFGVGAGIFFLGYALFEVPSNLILARVGARRWLARIMVTWGVIACAMISVKTPNQFYVLRFLLGVAEAGFFPGVIYYLGYWFPSSYRARAIAGFSIAIPLSQALGGPIGGALLGLNGYWHLAGWQWLFLVEGLPAVMLGMVTLGYLTERPDDAHWLSSVQRNWLSDRLRAEEVRNIAGPLQALANPLVWLLTVPYFALFTVIYGYNFWAPLLVRDALHTGSTQTGFIIGGMALLSAGSYVAAAILSDRKDERCSIAAFGLSLSCVGYFGMAFLPSPGLRMTSLVIVAISGPMVLAPFWCLPAKLLKREASAAGIAFINAVGSSGGFFGPAIIGFFRQRTGQEAGAYIALAGLALLGSLVCVGLGRVPVFKPRSAQGV